MAYKKQQTFGVLPSPTGKTPGTFERPTMPPQMPFQGAQAGAQAQQSSMVPPEPGGGTPGNPPNPPGGGGGAGQCPPGQVWRDDAKGAYGSGTPGCEPEDWRSTNGQDTCLGAPPEGCIPECVWCDFKDAQLKCDNNCNTLGGYGGGGGKGGGHGGNKPSGGGLPLDPALMQAEYLWNIIMDRLKGPSRYTPEVMSSLLGGIKMGAENQAMQRQDESNADLASRSLARSGVAAGAAREIRGDVASQVLTGRNNIFKAKIDADYQDKTQAIQEAMKWVDSLRDYVARMAATKAQKDAAMANIALGYARLEQELQMMREGYAQQLQFWQITNGGLGF